MREGAIDLLAEIRRETPVVWTDRYDGFWAITSYEGCYEAVRAADRFGQVGTIPTVTGGYKIPPINYDPPEHEVYRNLLQGWFTLKRMTDFAGFIRDCARARVRALQSPCDLVAGFTKPFPRDVILGIIGVADADMDFIGNLLSYGLEHAGDDPDGVRAATMQLRAYFVETLISSRRRAPTDDLVSHLVGSQIDGVPLSDELIAAFIQQVIGAGIDTTNRSMATGLAIVAEDLDAQRAMRQATMGIAVEEILRLTAPVAVGRRVRNDTQLGGQTLRTGERLLNFLVAANRDPAQFPDPDQPDFDRAPNRHIAFGTGIHRCLGMHLARMEMAIGFEELFNIAKEIRLQRGQRPTFTSGQVWGVTALPIEFDAV